jgi:hypothetical protein
MDFAEVRNQTLSMWLRGFLAAAAFMLGIESPRFSLRFGTEDAVLEEGTCGENARGSTAEDELTSMVIQNLTDLKSAVFFARRRWIAIGFIDLNFSVAECNRKARNAEGAAISSHPE